MKVIVTNQTDIRSPETLISLLQKRIALIWSYKVSNAVQKIIFKSMYEAYTIVPNESLYTIHFNNNVLLDLIYDEKGIANFDKYLMEIENILICQL